MYQYTGVDLSADQPSVAYKSLKSLIAFAYVKVCEGLHTIDPLRTTHATGIYNAMLHLGYYYFAHPGRCDARASAQFFKAQLGALPAADLLPALDIEINEENITPADLLQWIYDFLDEFGAPMMIYGGPGFLDANLPADHDLGKYPLWLAEYEGTPAPTLYPVGWSDCAIWQKSGNGNIAGIANAVDINLCNNLPLIPPPVV